VGAYNVCVRQELVQIIARSLLAVGDGVGVAPLLQELPETQLVLHTACTKVNGVWSE